MVKESIKVTYLIKTIFKYINVLGRFVREVMIADT